MGGYQTAFGDCIAEKWSGSRDGAAGIFEGDSPQGEIHLLGIAMHDSFLSCAGIGKQVEDSTDGTTDRASIFYGPAEAEPDIDRTHSGAKACQLVIKNELEHATKRLGMRLVYRL